MVGYISKYLSYTQSCVGCIGRLVYSSKTSLWGSPEYAEGSMHHCFTEKYYTSIILSFYTLRLRCKSCGRSSKAAHSDMKPQNTVPLSQA